MEGMQKLGLSLIESHSKHSGGLGSGLCGSPWPCRWYGSGPFSLSSGTGVTVWCPFVLTACLAEELATVHLSVLIPCCVFSVPFGQRLYCLMWWQEVLKIESENYMHVWQSMVFWYVWQQVTCEAMCTFGMFYSVTKIHVVYASL